jgi:hypothetical protein
MWVIAMEHRPLLHHAPSPQVLPTAVTGATQMRTRQSASAHHHSITCAARGVGPRPCAVCRPGSQALELSAHEFMMHDNHCTATALWTAAQCILCSITCCASARQGHPHNTTQAMAWRQHPCLPAHPPAPQLLLYTCMRQCCPCLAQRPLHVPNAHRHGAGGRA